MEEPEGRIARLLGAHATIWQRRMAPWQPPDAVAGGNDRFTVHFEDGRRVFLKAARAVHTADWLRREAEVYAHLRGPFIAELRAFEDDPVEPLLVIEDLSAADWGVHWGREPRRGRPSSPRRRGIASTAQHTDGSRDPG